MTTRIYLSANTPSDSISTLVLDAPETRDVLNTLAWIRECRISDHGITFNYERREDGSVWELGCRILKTADNKLGDSLDDAVQLRREVLEARLTWCA